MPTIYSTGSTTTAQSFFFYFRSLFFYFQKNHHPGEGGKTVDLYTKNTQQNRVLAATNQNQN
jgi:hypothetical protein